MCFVGTTLSKISTIILSKRQIAVHAAEIKLFCQYAEAININAEIGFDRSWCDFKDKYPFQTKTVVRNYFETNLLPVFKQNSSIIIKSAGDINPQNGITNNASESMNAVLHRLQNWKQVPLDISCYSLFQMCCYYQREIERVMWLMGSKR